MSTSVKALRSSSLSSQLPFGQVPVLEVDGVVYAQSIAIARYAARMTDLYPTDTTDALFVDMITDTFIELNGPLYGACFCLDAATKREKIDVFLATSLPKYFTMLEKTVQGKFFLGKKLSLADFLLFDAVVYLIHPNMPAFNLSTYPKLEAIVSEVKALPTLKNYLSKSGAVPRATSVS